MTSPIAPSRRPFSWRSSWAARCSRGEAGVGKTELAKVLAASLGTS